MTVTWMRRLTTGLLALLVLALAACSSGDDGGDPPVSALGTLSGRVVASVDGSPLADASVSVGELSTRTAADGSFTLAQVPEAERALLLVSAAGYVDARLITPVVAGQVLKAEARLLPEAPAQTFDATSAAVIETAGSAARVALPAASLVDAASGAPASGTVSVSVTPIDPARDPGTMPGDYSASDGGRIESFGAINVTLRDAAGRRLQLKSGSSATIRIPLASRAGTPPATVPLYWFDDSTGLWVAEGQATLAGSAPRQYYEGQVSHFTTWNADQPQDTIYVNGCVADETGQRLAAARVFTSGLDYSGMANALSKADGTFRVAIRKGGRASLWAERENTSNTVVVGPSDVDITLTECLVIGSGVQPPEVVQPPQDYESQAGFPAFFSVVATGTRPLAYQWQHDGVNIVGATSDWLMLDSVSAADAGRYTVVVRNAAGQVTSAVATLTVSAPVAPVITLAPQSQSVIEGDPAFFSVLASGSAPLAYQWLRNDVAVADATGATYTLAVVAQADDGARFSVKVSNAAGSVSSSAAVLTVGAPALAAPEITRQPLDGLAVAGQKLSFSVTATGKPTPTYQWRRNGSNIAGATAASYTTPALSQADDGALYSVVVRNSEGAVTSRDALATVTVSDAEAKLQLVRLMSLSFDFYEAASVPLLLISDTSATFVSAASVCSAGSISGQLDGGALPPAGTAVPPTATLAASASACEADGTVHGGSASVSYALSNLTPPVGSATATVTKMRLTDRSGSELTRDVTANGGGSVTLAGSVAGNQTSQTITLTPAAGATLRNELSALTATFASGSVAFSGDIVTTTQLPLRTRVSYADLRFAVAGVNYLASGAYELTFDGKGGFTGGSGEALLSSGGVPVGRIYANADGLFIEVNGISQPFKAGRTRAR